MKNEEEDEIKVILLGNSGVGKTNLINIAIGNEFNEEEKTTTASTFAIKHLSVNSKDYILNLWDTIGQEKFRQLTKIFFNNSKIVIFVYDISNKESFDALPGWLKDVEDQIGTNFVKGIVANKVDLYFYEQVKPEEGEQYADSINATFLQTSAKTESPKKFDDFLAVLVEEYISKENINPNGRFTLTSESTKEENKHNKCCK